MNKSLETKLQKIKKQIYKPKDFIIADAKDGDMAMGIVTPGPKRDSKGKILKSFKKLNDYKQAMISMSKSNLVDIMLMSASTGEELIKKKIFINSKVTPAIRMNDTTDIWLMRNGNYRSTYPRPFRSARLKSVSKFANLGLFSMTFSKSLKHDLEMLNFWRYLTLQLISA